MSKLSKAVRDQLHEQLQSPFAQVSLLCDGYTVTLAVRPFNALSYRIMTYVNGCFKGEWMLDKNKAPESKFLRPSVTSVFSASQKRKVAKQVGKRFAKTDPHLNATFTTYVNDWVNGKAALTHLNRVCTSIEVLPDDTTTSTEAETSGSACA